MRPARSGSKGVPVLTRPPIAKFIVAIIVGTAAATAFLAMQWGPAQAQGMMSAPACQCSPPTIIGSMSSSVVHCLCGGMSCVVSEHKEQGKNTNLMQCVK
jgi:hypothetical protein